MFPSPHDLKSFIEIAHTKNLSRASERLGVSQPSLSFAVRRLESFLGTPVLYRHRTGVELTQAGQQLLAQSRPLLEGWENLKSKTLNTIDSVQGFYRIGCHPSVALYTLGAFLPGILQKYPLMDVSLKHDLSRKICEEVISSQIDLGIVVNPLQHPDLIIHPLGKDKVTLWCGSKLNEVSLFSSKKMVLLCDPNLIQVQAILNGLKKKNIRVQRLLTSNSLEVIADLTKRGCGIGILPSRVAKRWDLSVCKEMESLVYLDEISLVFRSENKRQKAIQVLAKEIRGTFQSEA